MESMLQTLRCALGRHLPKKSLARFDGTVFHAPCRGCGTPMVREPAGWEALRVAKPARAQEAPVAVPAGEENAARSTQKTIVGRTRSLLLWLGIVVLLLPLAIALGYKLAPRNIEMRPPTSGAPWHHRPGTSPGPAPDAPASGTPA